MPPGAALPVQAISHPCKRSLQGRRGSRAGKISGVGHPKSRREELYCTQKSKECYSNRQLQREKRYYWNLTLEGELSVEEFNEKVAKIIEEGDNEEVIRELANQVHIPGMVNLGGGRYEMDMESSEDDIVVNAVYKGLMRRKSG